MLHTSQSSHVPCDLGSGAAAASQMNSLGLVGHIVPCIRMFARVAVAVSCIFAALTGSAAWAQSVLSLSCGTEGGRACTQSDLEGRRNSTTFTYTPCDYGLRVEPPTTRDDPPSGTCVNQGRETLPDIRNTQLGRYMHDQLYSVQADQPLNRVLFFGTHNSFSGYHFGLQASGNLGISLAGHNIGFGPNLIADQDLSITDQLQDGARFIRLDPHLYDGDIRVCHDNQDYVSETDLCGSLTFGRLFIYAINEINHWLRQNPGEFVVLRLNHSVGNSAAVGVLGRIVSDAFQDIAIPNQIYGMGSSAVPTWPTLRQARMQGKQILIIGEDETPFVWKWENVVIDDGYTDDIEVLSITDVVPTFGLCLNQSNASVPARPNWKFSYIAEDRSGSNALTDFFDHITSTSSTGGLGLLNGPAVAKAVQCGYGLVGIDFWDRGSEAYHSSILGKSFDYTNDDTNDDRRRSSLWTLGGFPGTASGQLLPPVPLPVVSKSPTVIPVALQVSPYLGWLPEEDAKQSFQYLCATSTNGDPFPSRGWTGALTEAVTDASGPWSEGEATCRSEFGSEYHFWAPETAQEQSEIAYRSFVALTMVQRDPFSDPAFSPDQKPIWLNYQTSAVKSAPPLSLTPNNVSLTWTKGDPIPALPTVFMKGGFGGRIDLSFDATSSSPHFVEYSAGPAESTMFLKLDSNVLKSLPAGQYVDTILVDDVDPDTNANVVWRLPVSITVKEPVGLVVSQPAVEFVNAGREALTQTIVLTSSDSSTSIQFSVGNQIPSWLHVAASSWTTPATITLTANPLNVPMQNGIGSASLTLNFVRKDGVPPTVQYPESSTVTIAVSQTTIATRPAGLQINVDGASYSAPQTFTWLVDTLHTVQVPQQVSPSPGLQYRFNSFAGSTTSSFTYAAQPAATTLTASYDTYYLLILNASPATGGSTTVIGGPADNYFKAGSSATVSASATQGYRFTGFTGAITSASSPASVTMNSPKSVTANFRKKKDHDGDDRDDNDHEHD